MTTLQDLRKLLKQLPPKKLALLLLLMFACGLTEGLGLMLLVPWLHWMQSGDMPANLPAWLPMQVMPLMLGGLLLLVVLRGLLQLGKSLLATHLQHQLVDSLRERVFSALLAAEWQWLTTHRQSDHASLLTTDIQRVGMGLYYTLGLLTSVVMLACYGVVAFVLSWPMTLLAVASGTVAFLLLARQRRQAVLLGQQLGVASRHLHATIQDNLASLKLTKLLGSAHAQQQELGANMQTLRARQMAFQRSNGLAQWLLQTIAAALLCSYIAIGLAWLSMPGADLLVLVFIFARMTPMLSALQQQLYGSLHALPALDSTLQLLHQSHTQAEPASLAAPPELAQELRLHQVSLRYAGRNAPALINISLTLPARSTTALVGASGAGKSTLADLISGLLVPDQGEVLLDGQALTGERRMAWRKAIAYVPQEVSLRNDSIRNNLSWGLPDISDDALWQALQRAAADFVATLPQGLDTLIGDHGVRLSGGERQRLGLARALLRRPALLILDEATSALDHEHEQRIREAVENLHGDLTLLIIGHRLAMLEHADQVAILSAGQLIGVGPWAEVGHLSGMPSSFVATSSLNCEA